MRKGLLLIALCVILCFLVVSPVFAFPGLSVGHIRGKGLSPEVSPGESYFQTLTARIDESDTATDVLIEVLGYGEDIIDGVKPLSPEDDTSPFSARIFIKPDSITLHVEPGETATADVVVTIPPDVGDGGRYAILRFSTAPTGEGMVGIVSVINLPMKFTIKDSQLIHTSEIIEVNTGEAVSGQPVGIFTSLKNTGNHHFKIEGQIEIRDAGGELIDTLHTTASSPIPEGTKKIKTTFIPKSELPLGVYSIKSRIMLEDGTLLDEVEGSFEVKEPYVPPPPPASVIATPGSPATLATQDGRISISFPQGAVISQVEISLQNYPLEQLPDTPADFQPATTCFRIDGLTGLLAKEATVTVKYTAADLEKAGGDASKLRLARWDEAEGQWSVLNTEVDKAANALTTHTNRLSLWAIMLAAPSPESPPSTATTPGATNWPLIGGSAAGFIVIVLLVYLLAVRRRGY